MQESNRADFGKLMFTAAEITGREISESSIELYWRLLGKYEFPDVERAVHSHLMNPDTGQFMPKPADIEKAIQGDTKSQALQAWAQVRTAIGAVGAYESVTFDDERTQAAILDMGGWVALCHTLESDLPFRAQEFQTRYRAYTLNPPVTWPSRLTGLIEQDCVARGFPHRVPPPRAVGSLESARRVYLAAGGEADRMPCFPPRPGQIERDRPVPAMPEQQASENRRQIAVIVSKSLPAKLPDPIELRKSEQRSDPSLDAQRIRALQYIQSRIGDDDKQSESAA